MEHSRSTGRMGGRHAVVTGAARGIGRALALGLAAEGALVECLDVDEAGAAGTAELIRAASECAGSGYGVDLAEPGQVERVLAAITDERGPVDVLVTAAGGAAGDRTAFLDLTLPRWEEMQRRNVTTTFVTCSTFARHFAGQGAGSIVAISSMSAELGTANLSHYSAAKGAVRQLVRSMAVELAPHGVRVNAVAPGATRTPGNAEVLASLPADHPLISRTPLGRYAEAEELVGAVVYLASDEASFTTGTTIAVDGGYTVA
ncbi:SDR family NAD(P)-dependent oxidoreductase [Nocardioides sediminis]|uniref:SDR family NAD(P)-dependent oxidoreductase n=1 Tax=Nocardioides sediminis TaxID=433648 RepID=UPI00131EE5A9|nr:SDR family NAD(P)-dependent oxidoreductase [Nocardioides sediminis]